MVEFCENCGAIIISSKAGEVVCSSCGHKNNIEKTQKVISEKFKEKEEVREVKESVESIHSIVDAECPKCKHNRAYFWTKQMRSSDEPESQFFKCVKCKHTWRNHKM